MTFRRTTSFPGKAAGAPAAPRQPVRPVPRTPAAARAPQRGALPGYAAAAPAAPKAASPSYRRIVICTLLLLCCLPCLALLDLYLTRHHLVGPQFILNIDNQVAKPKLPQAATPSAAPRQLPLFIPQVAPDPGYPAGHPGWQRYQADGLEYLVYRENGSVRAVQVLSEGQGAIAISFFKMCLRLSSGQEDYQIGKTEQRGGFQVEAGTLPHGQELQVYRESAGGAVRGFVITYPAAGQARQG